jgi:hypothetical protein
MQSEIYFVNGEKVRVGMSVQEAQDALSPMKAAASGLLAIKDASDRDVMVNPVHVTHVVSVGRGASFG